MRRRSIEEFKSVKNREEEFQTQMFEWYARSEPRITKAIADMLVSGSSTRKVVEPLMGVEPISSAIAV